MIWLFGILLLLIGLFLIISAFLTQKPESEKLPELAQAEEEKKFGGLVLIGPIPIVFGDAKLAIVAMILAITLMLLSLILILGWSV